MSLHLAPCQKQQIGHLRSGGRLCLSAKCNAEIRWSGEVFQNFWYHALTENQIPEPSSGMWFKPLRPPTPTMNELLPQSQKNQRAGHVSLESHHAQIAFAGGFS